MSEFQKDKYKFSIRTNLTLVNGSDIEGRAAEIEELNSYLFEKKIIIKDLVTDSPEYGIRNTLLNIAYFIVEDIELFDYINEKNKLPINRMTKRIPIARNFLEKWKDYILTYVIIFSNPKFKNIQDYLKVEDAINILGVDEIKEDLSQKQYKGIIIAKGFKNVTILTATGEFKQVKKLEENKIGEEITGEKIKTIRDYKLQLAILLTLIILVATTIGLKYTSTYSTVIIETTSQIKLEINSFNKVIGASSGTKKGRELINIVNIQDENIDNAVVNILDYAIKNEMILDSGISITVTGKPLKYGILEETETFMNKNHISAKFNNSGNENILNP
ncbi:hypothetical protein JCM1393_15320 [Clostridium carnis]